MSILAGRRGPSEATLPDGASVGVIGAGPAGSFFALHLLSLLRGAGRTARITLIDRKTFSHIGPSGCNMCAGAIGPAMVEKIAGLSLPFDRGVISRIADGYDIHGRDVSVTIRHPEKGDIYTVFRGGGPVRSAAGPRSFEQFLLDAAIGRGAEFLHTRVESVEKIPAGYRLTFPDGLKRDFDFLVGAFGVNTSLSRKLPFAYRPPKTWHTVQAEIPAGSEFIEQRLRNRIHIIPATGAAIRFLAITPKHDFLTLTGVGEHVRFADLEVERTRNHALVSLLPPGAKVLCHCHPEVPTGAAELPYSDRMAIIGDAFISRHLKNGIESSHDTAGVLATAITTRGISEAVLRDHFYRPCMRLFRYDNVWGRVLFGIYESVLRKGRLSDAYLRSVKRELSEGGTGQERILWAVFAGDSPYREIAREAFDLRLLWKMALNLLGG